MYKRIIDDTFEQSQVTFEEEGINPQTLDELRTVGSFLLCVAPKVVISIFHSRLYVTLESLQHCVDSLGLPCCCILSVMLLDSICVAGRNPRMAGTAGGGKWEWADF